MRQETHHSDALLDTRSGEHGVAALAHRQHGVVSAAQLRALGLGRGAIGRRVATGRLHRLHRGVYAVGHARVAPRGRLWAAVLACGGADRAVLSHRSAASVWDLVGQPRVADVTTLAQSRSMPGICVHRGSVERVVQQDGLPVTTVARTLLGLATVVSEHRLRRICHRAELLRILDVQGIRALLSEERGGRGTARLRRAIDELAVQDLAVTRSELEERFLALVAAAGLPAPQVNAGVAGFEVDFVWPAARLVVETDGAAAHLTPTAFRRDRERDAALVVAGYRVLRFTWEHVTREPERVAGALRELLLRHLSSGAR
ncbi:MAG TPA: type IV toxin-antitoxin system AbiEi family antitoxin domain-containing protein [Solirubrobacteraceae bacterium]|nr:type IV toxin-antitoxin system AbiEi family antitoxin domain-containing protein [Solirubrobacteraceae bacterium]